MDVLDILRNVLLVLHFVGLAAVLGGFLVQVRARPRRIDPFILHGAFTQLLTGLLLVGVAQARDVEVDNAKIGVKLVVVLVILVLAWRKRKAPSVSTGEWGAIGGLALLNTVVAVFW